MASRHDVLKLQNVQRIKINNNKQRAFHDCIYSWYIKNNNYKNTTICFWTFTKTLTNVLL